jgi:filamentous hemagglutinin family protein
MKITPLHVAGLLPALLVAPLHSQGLGEPVLSTPGTATWLTETTATGSRMVFTITGDTILDWGQFNLAKGSELVFDFVGGDSVANMLNGSATNFISGNVTSNGNVGFFSPNGALRVPGTVTAESVTLATMTVDPAAFNAGSNLDFEAVAGSTLTVTGAVRATGGNVLLVGKGVRVGSSGTVEAADTVRMAGGSQVRVERGGIGRRLNVESGDGFVFHMGATRAARIEVAAGAEISNGGRLEAGSSRQRIFLEVGSGGKISQDPSGIMIGRESIRGTFDADGDAADFHEGDAAQVISTSSVKMPALKRPDGSQAASSRTLVNDVSLSASADSGRDRKKAANQVASRDKAAKPLLQRGSFFGMRGGSATVAKR